MPPDARLFLLSLLASTTTTLLLISQVLWIVLTLALRRRGRRVTYLHHDWQKMREEIAYVNSPEEREKYERWAKFLRYSYWIWAMTMITLALLAFFIYN